MNHEYPNASASETEEVLCVEIVEDGIGRGAKEKHPKRQSEPKFEVEISDEGNAIITGLDRSFEGTLVIPATIDGHSVTEIGEGAFYGGVSREMGMGGGDTEQGWLLEWPPHGAGGINALMGIHFGCLVNVGVPYVLW